MERVGERSFRSSKRAVFMSSPFRIRSPHCRMMQNATRRLIALQDGPVILVGHSWGGAVITEAGDDPKVVGLVYVAAFLLEAGASANQTSAPFGPTPVQKTIQVDAQHCPWLSEEGVFNAFADGLPIAYRSLILAVQGQLNEPISDSKLT